MDLEPSFIVHIIIIIMNIYIPFFNNKKFTKLYKEK